MESSRHKALTKFTVGNILYALACYGFYCVTLYFFISGSLSHSQFLPDISVKGNYEVNAANRNFVLIGFSGMKSTSLHLIASALMRCMKLSELKVNMIIIVKLSMNHR